MNFNSFYISKDFADEKQIIGGIPLWDMPPFIIRSKVEVNNWSEQVELEQIMRLDKYLKVSRLIKRRTVANEACDAGRVMVNGRVAKASLDVKVGDVIEIAFGNKSVRAQVLQVADTSRKEDAKEMFKYL